jgi:hypothetical protein
MSVKLSISHVMTVRMLLPAAALSTAGVHSSSTTGCQVGCHCMPVVATGLAGVPMLRPNVKSVSKRRKKSTYHSGPCAIASWVNAGSLSMKAVCGIAAYSSRQNQEPPERSRKRSAVAHSARHCSSVHPWNRPSKST